MKVETVTTTDTVMLKASGEIDLASADELRDTSIEALSSPGCVALVIDLTGVTFMDSTGLGAMVAVRNAALRSGQSLSLRGLRPSVARVFELSGLDHVFALE